MRFNNQDNEKLKELIPDIDQESIPYGYYGCDIRDVQQQTENLRKAVKALIEVTNEGGKREMPEDFPWCFVTIIEQITGKKYEEIC